MGQSFVLDHKTSYLQQKLKNSSFSKYSPPKKQILELFENQSSSLTCSLMKLCGSTDGRVNWIDCFIEDCHILSKTYNWAKEMPNLLKKFKGFPDDYYQSEIPIVLLKTNELFMNSQDFTQKIFSNSDIKTTDASKKTFSKLIEPASLENPLYVDEVYCFVDRKSRDFDCITRKSTKLGEKNNTQIPNSRKYYENSSILNLEMTEKNQEKSLKFYKSVLNIVEKHLNDKGNSLNFLLQCYIKSFFSNYSEHDNLDLDEKNMGKILDDVKEFVNLMRNALYLYYNIAELSGKIRKLFNFSIEVFTFDNITNFFTSYFFQKTDIYEIIFDMQCKIDLIHENMLIKNLSILKDWEPEDFGVSEAFCLNYKTVRFLKRRDKTVHTRNFSFEKYYEDDNADFIDKNSSKFDKKNKRYNFPPQPENNISKKIPKPKQSIEKLNKIFNQPYLSVIEKLEIFCKLKSPIHQLKALGEAFELILESISDFYAKFDHMFDKVVESDELISIFIYILSRIELKNVFSHIKIIEKFISQNYVFNIVGYQLVTFRVCINYIENINEIEVRKDRSKTINYMRESIMTDIQKEAESQLESKQLFI